MPFETALREDALQRIAQIGQAEILVGIPSYNNAGTIAHVVKMAAQGMVKHFPDMKPVLINSDGGSSDGTRQVVLDTPVLPGVEVIATEYQGLPGKGSAFRAIFETARALGAKACVVVDSDLRSITPQWIKLLADPVVGQGYDYVTPYYSRHKYDGTITNNITFPMTRMLYGLEVRQPIGGDFGFSGKLVSAYLERGVDDHHGHQREWTRLPGSAWSQGPRRQRPGGRPGAHVRAGGRHPLQPHDHLPEPLGISHFC